MSHQLGDWFPSKHALGPLQPTNLFFFGPFSPFFFFFWGGLENKPIKLHAKAAFARKVLPPGRFPPCAVRCCPGRFYSNRCCWPRYLFFIPRFGDHLACLLVSMMTSRDGSTWKKRYFRRGTLWNYLQPNTHQDWMSLGGIICDPWQLKRS